MKLIELNIRFVLIGGYLHNGNNANCFLFMLILDQQVVVFGEIRSFYKSERN